MSLNVQLITIGIDWDDTYTTDRWLWAMFCGLALDRGHRVWIVTARRNTEENREVVQGPPGVPVAFTGLTPKQWYMEEKLGVKVDVWIDNDPETLVRGY